MKEIDFIPQWYKARRERKRRYIRQYTLMATVFTVMVGWGFIVDSHISRVSAEVDQMQESYERTNLRGEQAAVLQGEIADMKKKTELLDTVAPRTNITAILGELSYLIQENVILSKLSLKNEPIQNSEKRSDPATAAVVRVAPSKQNKGDDVISSTPSRCRVVITGIAASHADAAELMARLEQTAYFDGVFPNYSKPKQFKDRDVTEFEIRCFVADYQELK